MIRFNCASFSLVNSVVTFSQTFTFTFDRDIKTSVIFNGTIDCNCTDSNCNRPSEEGLGQNTIFYIVIGCVGVLIVLVIVVTVFYHCVLVGTWRKNRTSSDEIK